MTCFSFVTEGWPYFKYVLSFETEHFRSQKKSPMIWLFSVKKSRQEGQRAQAFKAEEQDL